MLLPKITPLYSKFGYKYIEVFLYVEIDNIFSKRFQWYYVC